MKQFYLSKEEKKILLISHVKWLSIVYNILPFIMLSFVTNMDTIIKIESLDAIYTLVFLGVSAFIDGVFYEKYWYKWYKGFCYILFVNLLLCVFLNTYGRLVGLNLIIGLLLQFNSQYGSMYNEVIKAKLDTFYVFYKLCFSGLFIFINPFGDIIYSYYMGSIINSILWFVLELFILIKRDDFKKMIKWDKEFFFISSRAFLRKSSNILHETLTSLGSFLIINNVSKDFALMVYVVIRKTPTFRIGSEFVQQLKRTYLKNIEINVKRLVFCLFILIVIESSIVNIISLYINQGYMVWWIFIISMLIQFSVLWFNITVDIKQMILADNMKIKYLFKNRLIFVIFVLTVRSIIPNAIFSYIPTLIGYFILDKLFKKYICKNITQDSTYNF